MPTRWKCTRRTSTYVDHYIGELIAFLEEMGQLDNTLIIAVSDNGASAEGGPHGSFNENLFFNGVPRHAEAEPQAPRQVGRADAPIRIIRGAGRMRPTRRSAAGSARSRAAAHRTCASSIGPRAIKAKDAIRQQFIHAIDLVPTTLDVLKMKIAHVDQRRGAEPDRGGELRGDASTTPRRRSRARRSISRCSAQRAIYLDGWRAYAPWKFGDDNDGQGPGPTRSGCCSTSTPTSRNRPTWPPRTRPSWRS